MHGVFFRLAIDTNDITQNILPSRCRSQLLVNFSLYRRVETSVPPKFRRRFEVGLFVTSVTPGSFSNLTAMFQACAAPRGLALEKQAPKTVLLLDCFDLVLAI